MAGNVAPPVPAAVGGQNLAAPQLTYMDYHNDDAHDAMAGAYG